MSNTETTKTCACGCGNPTKGDFSPGHDARDFGQVRRGERPEADLAPYPGLMGKLAAAKAKDAARQQSAADLVTTHGMVGPTGKVRTPPAAKAAPAAKRTRKAPAAKVAPKAPRTSRKPAA